MFDVLVYVYENYLPEACPEAGALARKLSAVGFDPEAISDALQWLAGLEQANEDTGFRCLPAGTAQRCYDEEETERLSAECRGFLAFLEQAQAVDPVTRELIVERAMAVEDPDGAAISLGKFKVIVLLVMWRRQLSLDNLVFENLLDDEDGDGAPVLH
jgi:Smg protein